MKRTDVEYVKALSRLYITEPETSTMQEHLSSILRFVERIHEVSLPEGAMETGAASPPQKKTRKDLPSNENRLSKEEVERLSPYVDVASGHLVVPAVID